MSTMINVIKNPEFTYGLSDWGTYCSYSGNKIEVLSSGGVSGKCIKLTVPPEKGQSFVYQDMILAPGDYTIKFFAKKISGDVDVWIQVKINGASEFSESFKSRLSSVYSEFEYPFDVTGSSNASVQIRLIAGSAEGVACFDNVSLMVEQAMIAEGMLQTGVEYYADVEVGSAGLRVRSSPSSSAAEIGFWPNGRLAIVEAIAGNNEWVKCWWKNTQAFVMKSYLRNFREAVGGEAQRLRDVGNSEMGADSHHVKYYATNADGSNDPDWCHWFADWIEGHCFWSWADIPNESNCREGVIHFLDEGIFAFVNAWHKMQVYTNTASTRNHMSSGELSAYEAQFVPCAGDYVYFRKCPGESQYNESETSYHVGIVTNVAINDNGVTITAIEGNTSAEDSVDGVGFVTYSPTQGSGNGAGERFHKNILGFGLALGRG